MPGGQLSILDGKQTENSPSWLFKIVLKLGGPFGYTSEYFHVRPWESVERYFKETSLEKKYGGMIYFYLKFLHENGPTTALTRTGESASLFYQPVMPNDQP